MLTSRMSRPRGRTLSLSLAAVITAAFALAGCSASTADRCPNGQCPVNQTAAASLSADANATDTPSASTTASPSETPSAVATTPPAVSTSTPPAVATTTVTETATVTRTKTTSPKTSSSTSAAPKTSSSTSKPAPKPSSSTSTAPAVVAGVTAGQGSAPTGNLSKRQLDAACAMYANGAHADLDKLKPSNTAWSWSCFDSGGTRLFDGGMSIDGYCGSWNGYTSNKAQPTDSPYAWTCVKL